MRLPIAFILLGLAAAAPAAQVAQVVAVDDSIARRVRADIEFLSSDHLEGRDTGSRGHSIAADYVAAQFRSIGLEPAGDKGSWFQQVPFRRASFEKVPKLTLTAGGKASILEQGKDAALRPSVVNKIIRKEVGFVFVGYGLTDTRFGLSDYQGLDVRGKIVVAIEGTPTGLPSDIAAHLSSSKGTMAAAAGAAGFVEISRTDPRPNAYNPVARGGRPRIDWVDATGRAGSSSPDFDISLNFSPEQTARLFEGAPRSLSAVRSEAKGKKRPRGFALTPTIAIDAESKWEDFKSPEVIGLLRGSDPKLAAEHIVLMGHLDHLGMKKDAKPGEDAIYNGALDNAAGVATMLEAARLFAAQHARPKRSILFIANTGEERGLLGAGYYAAHPTVPAASIVGLVDLDMPLLLYPFTDVTAFGAEHSTIGAMVAEAGKSMNVSVSPDPMPEEAIFVRSDHYMFVKQGVPAVLLMTGHANGGKAKWNNYLGTIYHTVKDDLTLPIDWQSGARYAVLNYQIARAMADAPERPMWLKGDYFGDLFAAGQPRKAVP